MTIVYKRPQHFAVAGDVWPGFEQWLGSTGKESYLIAWFMRDVLLPPYEPHFGDPL